MAYHMKGSPAKLGTIQGTTGHASALKKLAESPAKDIKSWTAQEMKEGSWVEKDVHNDKHRNKQVDSDHKPIKRDKKASPTKEVKSTVEVSGGKRTVHKDISGRGGWNKKIRDGIKAGHLTMRERSDGSTYQQWTGGEDFEAAKAAKRDKKSSPATKMDKSSLPDGRAKSSAFQKDTDPVKKPKRTMSVSDEQTLIDNQNLEKAANRDKQGGIGDRTEEQQAITEKSRKRQAVIEAQEMGRKELKKNAKGSKLKKFFTSTKKLKSEVTAKAYRDAKGKKGQALQEGDIKDKDKYSGVTES